MLPLFDTVLRANKDELGIVPALARHAPNSITISPGLNRPLSRPESPNNLMRVPYQSIESNSNPNVSRATTTSIPELSSTQSRPNRPHGCQAQFQAAKTLLGLKHAKTEEGARGLTPCPESAASIRLAVNGNFNPSLSSSPVDNVSQTLGFVSIAKKRSSFRRQVGGRGRQEYAAGLEFEASIVTMNPRNDQVDSPKPRARNRSDARSSVNKLMNEVNNAVGGEPADDATKEEWDRYLGNYINELDQRTGPRSWPQLEKAEQFVKRMGQAPFRRVNYSSDEDDAPKAGGSTAPGQQKVQTGKSHNNNKGTAMNGKPRERRRETTEPRKNEVRAASMGKQAAKDLQELEDAKQSRSGNGVKASTSNIIPLGPSLITDQDSPQHKKRCQRAVESLMSELGKNWQPHADEQGRRLVRRGANKN
ncbi:hypothetical protein F4813DRAFT_151808 [Daldinia decipiens]|uniref:uncharacterized protein n=1 Tax=Daldinia decipiens TaxID=326647 RepID=UPI0020C332B1|nr:uncharacterized protein F4813DRAFT_151808 [Daldinia decipiens]KAI1655720.1 hypothetical protein F4813DRAFT_151808 [Daldinia decipiens]